MFALALPVAAQGPLTAPPDAAPPLSQNLLDSLLAPIALYPDRLLTQVLMASAYPLEVIEADGTAHCATLGACRAIPGRLNLIWPRRNGIV
jgi:Protein of unknown function (DUF3300)